MPKGTFKPYLLYERFTHEKAGFPQTNEESPPFFVYRIKSRFSVKRRNPNPSPTWKIKFGFLSFGPSDWIRTSGLLNPIQARYQTSPHPVVSPEPGRLVYISMLFPRMQALFSNFSKNFSRPRNTGKNAPGPDPFSPVFSGVTSCRRPPAARSDAPQTAPDPPG